MALSFGVAAAASTDATTKRSSGWQALEQSHGTLECEWASTREWSRKERQRMRCTLTHYVEDELQSRAEVVRREKLMARLAMLNLRKQQAMERQLQGLVERAGKDDGGADGVEA